MTKQCVCLVDLWARHSSGSRAKIRSLLEQNRFEVYGCILNIDSDFEHEEAGREHNI